MNVPPRIQNQSLKAWVNTLPEFFVSTSEITRDTSNARRNGLIRKVGPRLYTTNLNTQLPELVLANALKVALLRYPGAIVSHRSALEMRPAENTVFLTGPYEASEEIEGLVIRVIAGLEPLPGDMPFLTGYRASNARAFLENLTPTRVHEVSRALPQDDIERRLIAIMDFEGESGLQALRDQAEVLAKRPEFEVAYQSLTEIIGTLVGTRTTDLKSHAAQARVAKLAFDHEAIAQFEILTDELQRNWSETARPKPALLRHERQNRAFIDAYFSNYIEGTQFLIEEAQSIVFDGEIPNQRPQDAHDILGTYSLLVDESEMGTSLRHFDSLEDFEYLLIRRHHTMIGGRPEKNPGMFKTQRNRAGNTEFVAPELVRGTLKEGLLIFGGLGTAFQRAAFIMYLVSQIHPFDDGNGRLARAMMNAELQAASEAPIIIATAYREDYLGGLRKLTREKNPVTYIRMLDRAHEYTSRLNFGDVEDLIATLRRTNAFDDSGARILKLP